MHSETFGKLLRWISLIQFHRQSRAFPSIFLLPTKSNVSLSNKLSTLFFWMIWIGPILVVSMIPLLVQVTGRICEFYTHNLCTFPLQYVFVSCATCRLTYFTCPGHFGHIELPSPVYHPLFMVNMFNLLRGTCLFCHRFKLSRSVVCPFRLQTGEFSQAFSTGMQIYRQISFIGTRPSGCCTWGGRSPKTNQGDPRWRRRVCRWNTPEFWAATQFVCTNTSQSRIE